MNEDQKAGYVYYSVAFIFAIFLVGLLAFAFFPGIGGQPTDENPTEENSSVFAEQTNETYASMAECLTAKGAILYGASWCPHCRNQKALFGDTANEIKYVECQAPNGGQTEECINAGIKAYPTWLINGKQYVGEKSLEELAQLTGCRI